MKRLSILILAAMLLTVGGVYATWNYAQGNAALVTSYQQPMMTDKVVDTAKGTISVNKDAVKIYIDDADNNHVAEATFEGELVVTFTPAKGADETVIQSGIEIQYSVTTTPDWAYEGTQIFTATNTDPVKITEMQRYVAEDGTVTFVGTIPVSEIQSRVQLGSISLPTAEDYEAFKQVLNRGNICVTVEEVVTTTPANPEA